MNALLPCTPTPPPQQPHPQGQNEKLDLDSLYVCLYSSKYKLPQIEGC
jgi:hypothetical protein